MDRLLRTSWPALLDEIAGQLNPIHAEIFGDFDLRYYWSVHQSEWATDIMFKDPEKLAGIYPRFLRHGLTTFASPDVRLLYASHQKLTPQEKRRQSGAVTRKLRLLRAHGLIKKVPKTHRYHLTATGSKAITAIIAAQQASADSLIKLAA